MQTSYDVSKISCYPERDLQTVGTPPISVRLTERPGVGWRGGGGVLPSKRLLGMCRWMGSHFHNWTDYNGVTFLVELREWGRTFLGYLG